jgi:hypothetical protein
LGHLRAIMGDTGDLFECHSGLIEHGGIISPTSIDQSSKVDVAFRQTALPVLSLDPDANIGR